MDLQEKDNNEGLGQTGEHVSDTSGTQTVATFLFFSLSS